MPRCAPVEWFRVLGGLVRVMPKGIEGNAEEGYTRVRIGDASASSSLLTVSAWGKPAAAAAAVPLLAAGGLAVWFWLTGRMNPRPIVLRLWSVAAPSRPLLTVET